MRRPEEILEILDIADDAGMRESGPGAVSYVIPQIFGDWESPFLNVTMRQDGTLTARLPDGSDRQGQWSVDTVAGCTPTSWAPRWLPTHRSTAMSSRSSSTRTRR
jgi:hypothetical protein